MRLTYLLSWLFIAGITLSSCRTNSDVVSSGLIQKRKYRPGFHWSKRSIQKSAPESNLVASVVHKTPKKSARLSLDQAKKVSLPTDILIGNRHQHIINTPARLSFRPFSVFPKINRPFGRLASLKRTINAHPKGEIKGPEDEMTLEERLKNYRLYALACGGLLLGYVVAVLIFPEFLLVAYVGAQLFLAASVFGILAWIFGREKRRKDSDRPSLLTEKYKQRWMLTAIILSSLMILGVLGAIGGIISALILGTIAIGGALNFSLGVLLFGFVAAIPVAVALYVNDFNGKGIQFLLASFLLLQVLLAMLLLFMFSAWVTLVAFY